MISKTDLKALIRLQKVSARKSIASKNVRVSKIKSHEQYKLFRIIADERKFLNNDFSNINDIHDLMSIVHGLRHNSITKISNFMKCKYCKNILSGLSIELPGTTGFIESPELDKEEKIKPRLGNLLHILKQEVDQEVINMEQRKMPSQNDLTRWALKEATYRWYRDKFRGFPIDTIVLDNIYDDRLNTKFAPDFSEIYEMWIEKLDELVRLDDKYGLNSDELDKAKEDLINGMRGSAFEKQLDRYREEFVQKLFAQI